MVKEVVNPLTLYSCL